MERHDTRHHSARPGRIVWSLKETADALGTTPAALRRRCERAAVDKPTGRRVAELEFGIVAVSLRRQGRWRFRIPQELQSGGGRVGDE